MRDIGVLDDGGLEAKGTRVWRGWHQLQEASSLIPLSERSASTPSALSRVAVHADSRPRACHDVVTCIVAHNNSFRYRASLSHNVTHLHCSPSLLNDIHDIHARTSGHWHRPIASASRGIALGDHAAGCHLAGSAPVNRHRTKNGPPRCAYSTSVISRHDLHVSTRVVLR